MKMSKNRINNINYTYFDFIKDVKNLFNKDLLKSEDSRPLINEK